MPLTPQDFVSKWKRVTSREKQTYQEHFIDLCRLVDHQTPNEADPTGKRYAFEMGTAKTSGGQGWADVAKLGYFGWEYKGKDSDLEKAYDQLLRYRDSLNNPPLLIVSDINNIIIRTNYTNLPTRTFTLTLDDLLNPESIRILKTVFFNPEQLKPKETIESVTREAATKFSKLADNLRKYGNDHKLHVFARDDDYFFGVLHSRIHEQYSLNIGSTLEDRPSYSSSRTFETFPFPWLPGKEPKEDPRVQAISQAAKELVEQRDRWLNPQVTVTSEVTVTSADKKKRTLRNLYNAHPSWLDLAHKRLDEAVFAAYGWKSDL